MKSIIKDQLFCEGLLEVWLEQKECEIRHGKLHLIVPCPCTDQRMFLQHFYNMFCCGWAKSWEKSQKIKCQRVCVCSSDQLGVHHVREKCFSFFFFKFTELLFVSLISPWMASSLRAHAVIPPVDICQEYTKMSTALMQQQNPGN